MSTLKILIQRIFVLFTQSELSQNLSSPKYIFEVLQIKAFLMSVANADLNSVLLSCTEGKNLILLYKLEKVRKGRSDKKLSLVVK